MKYIIYRFPDVIRFDHDDKYAEPYVVRKRGITKKALQGEIVAVEYGSDIHAVKDALIKNIQEEMRGVSQNRRTKKREQEKQSGGQAVKLLFVYANIRVSQSWGKR